jgi:hypothetical protein
MSGEIQRNEAVYRGTRYSPSPQVPARNNTKFKLAALLRRLAAGSIQAAFTLLIVEDTGILRNSG